MDIPQVVERRDLIDIAIAPEIVDDLMLPVGNLFQYSVVTHLILSSRPNTRTVLVAKAGRARQC